MLFTCTESFNPIHHGFFWSMKLSLQKHAYFLCIVCLFLRLVCVTWCDFEVISLTTPLQIMKIKHITTPVYT